MPTDVHVVAGYLGAGKTTVLTHLLSHISPSERVGIVVNDFGEASMDADRLRESGAPGGLDVRNIDGRCICCTAPEGLVSTVGELVGEVDRLFVEPTGIARPADVIDTLRRAPFADELRIGPLVVVVDPARLARGELPANVVEQARAADVIVANRMDRAGPDDVAALDRWVAEQWPGPHEVVKTEYGAVPASVLAWPPEGPRERPIEHDHSHHGMVAATLRWAPDVRLGRAALLDALGAHPIERVKGLFHTDEGTIIVEVAGGRVEEATSGRRGDARVDLIGADESALDALAAALQAAVLSAEQLAHRGEAIDVALPDGAMHTFDRDRLAALPEPVPDVAAIVPGRTGTGARLAALLDAVGAPADGEVVVVAADGYVTDPVPVATVRTGVLVHTVADGPLPRGKGGPFRLYLPPSESDNPCANVKGVVRIALRRAS